MDGSKLTLRVLSFSRGRLDGGGVVEDNVRARLRPWFQVSSSAEFEMLFECC
jgi:hypothetical protein